MNTPLRLAYVALTLISATLAQGQSRVMHQTNAYTIFSDEVKQGSFSAKARAADEIVSNYSSPQNQTVSSRIEFKFSINGKDNEMKPGLNHEFDFTPGQTQTPLILFGQPLQAHGKISTIKPESALTVRLDLRPVLAELKSKGFYTTFKGDKIFEGDFKNVYIAGATAPLSWDFDNLHQRTELEMKDPDGDGIYETTLVFNAQKDKKQTEGIWKRTKNTAAFPQYSSDDVLADAMYRLSLEEMVNAVEPDSTFRTGKEWAGVWTRDISYSIILSMAYLQPKVAMNSLMKKVSPGKRIIQDTGTGGAYPVSTDRIIWATAAWEVYQATGDRNWLETIYEIIKNTIEDDYLVAYNLQTGLVRGESSFLDWREQTYPKWMQPADIFDSYALGTNAAHYQGNVVLAQIADLLSKPDVAARHNALAEKIKQGINTHLWQPDKGYYAQYLYGRNYPTISPRAEALGEALCIWFGIADEARAKQIVESTPQTPYGISCIYPQIPDLPPYHNDAVWPFVQSYWALASAKAGNQASVMESIAAIYRPAALFLTNKENFVAGNGDFAGTVINSSNMLWSLSGSLALVHKVLFGMRFEDERLVFRPMVPKSLAGKRQLLNFKYRKAILDIELDGAGDRIESFMIDGKKALPEIAATLKGRHRVQIRLSASDAIGSKINKRENYFSLPAPLPTIVGNQLSWPMVKGAVVYQILRNGKVADQTTALNYEIAPGKFAEYQVIAVDATGVQSLASEPIAVSSPDAVKVYEMERFAERASYNYKGFNGDGFVETSKTVNASVDFTIDIESAGMYAIDFRYANGNGPTNTENKCAIRTLKSGGERLGTFVFPQRGVQQWSNWGYSNAVKGYFEKGAQSFTLSLDAANENMNGAVNQAMLDQVRVTKLD